MLERSSKRRLIALILASFLLAGADCAWSQQPPLAQISQQPAAHDGQSEPRIENGHTQSAGEVAAVGNKTTSKTKDRPNDDQPSDKPYWLDRHAGSVQSLLLLVLAGLTLWYVLATRTLATISDQQNKLTEINQRAYIAVDGSGVCPLSEEGDSIAEISVRNVGRLPARDVKWFIDAAIDSCGKRSDFRIDESRFYPIQGRLVLPPGTKMRRSHRADFAKHFAAFQEEEVGPHLYVWGEIRYEDGFGVSRFTKFCHRYPSGTVPDIPEGDFYGGRGCKSVPAERMRYHQFGNDAD